MPPHRPPPETSLGVASLALPERPRIWTAFAAFGVAFAWMSLAGIAITLGAALFLVVRGQLSGVPGVPDARILLELWRSPYFLAGLAALSAIVQAEVAILAAALSPVRWRARLRLSHASASRGAVLVAMVGALAFSEISDGVLALTGLQLTGAIGRMVLAFRGAPWPAVLLMAVGGGLGAGIAEELLFRGYVQTRLVQRWGPRVGVVTALLFGALHLDPVQSTFAFAIGLVLGWLTERTGSIRPAMAAHALNNSVWVLSLRFVPFESKPAMLVHLAVASSVTLGCALLLRRWLAPSGTAREGPGAPVQVLPRITSSEPDDSTA